MQTRTIFDHPLLGALILPFVLYFSPWRYDRAILAQVGSSGYFLDTLFNPTTRRPASRVLAQAFLSITIYTALIIALSLLLFPKARLEYYGLSIFLQFGMLLFVMVSGGFSSDFAKGTLIILGAGGVFGVPTTFVTGAYSAIQGTMDADAVAAFVDSPAGLALNAVVLMMAVGMIARLALGVSQSRYREVVGYALILLFAGFMTFFSRDAVADTNTLGAIVLVITYSGVWILPFQLVITLIIWIWVTFDPSRALRLWRLAPAAWDQFFPLPTPEVAPILRSLYQHDRDHFHEFARACEQQFSGVFWGRTINRIQREG